MSMTLHSANIIVTTAGTPVKAFAQSTLARAFAVQGLSGNTKYCYVEGIEQAKGFTVSALYGFTMNAMGSDALYELKDLNIDADVSGEGVGIVWYG